MKLLILSLVIFSALAGTNYYKNRGSKNTNNQYFDARTLGSGSHRIDNKSFRKQINKQFECEGEYCNSGKYKCKGPGDTGCYHVEHIVDINGPEYKDHPECKDIAGNKIMASGKWNTGLGGYANKDYLGAQGEKQKIYGSDIITSAHNSIRQCIGMKTLSNDDIEYIFDNNSTYIDKCLGDTCSCDSDDICGCECDFEQESVDYTYFYAILSIVVVSCVINIVGCSIYIYGRCKNNNYIPGFDRSSINMSA